MIAWFFVYYIFKVGPTHNKIQAATPEVLRTQDYNLETLNCETPSVLSFGNKRNGVYIEILSLFLCDLYLHP